MSESPDPLKPTTPPRRLIPGPYVFGLGRFVRCLPSVLPAALFLSIAWFDFGSGLNVPATFWAGGFVTGLSVTLLFAYLALTCYLLDATYDPHLLGDDPEPRGWPTRLAVWAFPNRMPEKDVHSTRLRAYMAVTFLPAVVLLALSTALRVSGDRPYVFVKASDPYQQGDTYLFAERWPALAGIGLAVAFLWVVHLIAGRLTTPWIRLADRHRWLNWVLRQDSVVNRNVVAWLSVIQLVLFLAYVAVVHAGWTVTDQTWRLYPQPVTAVCMLFGVLAGVSGVVWYRARRVALPAFVVLGVWLYASNSTPYKLTLPNMEPEYASRVRLADHDGPAGTWDGIANNPKTQAREWDRVLQLTRTRIGMLKEPREYLAKWDELKARPDRPAAYRELVELYIGALDRAELDELDALNAWRKTAPRGAGRPKPKLAIVTVTGGANRSALWTAKVLHELHNELGGFPKHVRLVAGASGGMVGAGYYAGSLQAGGALPAAFDPLDVAQDHIVPIMGSLVFQEVPHLAWRGPYTHDRGHALDLSLEGKGPHLGADGRRLGAAFDRTFESLRAGEDEGWRPPLVYTPMMIEDGRRLFISNRNTHYLTTSTGNILLNPAPPQPDAPAAEHATAQSRTAKQFPTYSAKSVRRWPAMDGASEKRIGTLDVYGRSGVEFFQLFPGTRDRFKVSTAARLNATFPYLSPAVDLPTEPARRVVDAGFYDNYGVGVAAGWIHFWRDWLAEHTSGVIVIQIRDSASHYDRRHLTRLADQIGRDDGSGVQLRTAVSSSSPVGWLTGPLAAVDKARQSTSSFRNDDLLAALDGYFKHHPDTADDPRFFETVVFERYSNVGMSWFLNAEDKRQILASWGVKESNGGPPPPENVLPNGVTNDNPKSLRLLGEWWNSR